MKSDKASIVINLIVNFISLFITIVLLFVVCFDLVSEVNAAGTGTLTYSIENATLHNSSDSYNFTIDTYGSFNRFTSPVELSVLSVPFINVETRLSNVPNNVNYIYFYGYGVSNMSITSANTDAGYCENISGSVGYESTKNNGVNIPTNNPFAFKCSYKGSSHVYFRLFYQSNLDTSINYAPRFYLYKYMFYSADDDADSVISSIQEQTQQQHEDSQATQDKIGEVGDKVGEVNDTLTDGSVDSDAINSIGSNLPATTGPLSAIINLPVRFFQVLLNALDTTSCPAISFNFPFVDIECSIPCVRNLLDQIGALDFYETIGTLVGSILLFKYIIYMGKTFQKMSDLEDTSSATWGGL